jgi:hypothetical protein
VKHTTPEAATKEARSHAKGNCSEIKASKYAGCFSCCHVFDSNLVVSWRDEWVSPETQNRVPRWTAVCPNCGNTSVVGSATGLLEDEAYLPIINHFVQGENAPNK